MRELRARHASHLPSVLLMAAYGSASARSATSRLTVASRVRRHPQDAVPAPFFDARSWRSRCLRWIAHRARTNIADEAHKRSGKSPVDLVTVPTATVLGLAGLGSPSIDPRCRGTMSALWVDVRAGHFDPLIMPVAVPEVAIQGFRLDADGIWVAELACGHRQHIRHNPPFQVADWVVSEAGRHAHIGARLPCKLCCMPQLPSDAVEYARTAVFNERTLPGALTRRHSLKPGTWGEIVVLSGRLLYVLEDEGLSLMLQPEVVGRIGPERPYHVELQAGTTFYVRFLRPEGARD